MEISGDIKAKEIGFWIALAMITAVLVISFVLIAKPVQAPWWNTTCDAQYPVTHNLTTSTFYPINDSANLTGYVVYGSNVSRGLFGDVFVYFGDTGFEAPFCGLANDTTEIPWQNTSNMRYNGSSNVTVYNGSGTPAFWPADEGTGNIANDAVGSIGGGFHTLTGSDVRWTEGMIGSAFLMDNKDVALVPDSDTNLAGMSVLTLQAWVRLDATNNTQKRIFNHGSNDYLLFVVDDSNNMRFCVADTCGSFIQSVIGQGGWTLVTVVYENANDRATMYFNRTNQTSGVIGASVPDTGSLTIGDDAGGVGDSRWIGALDEIRIYNRSLSGNEIADIFNCGAFDNCTGLGNAILRTANTAPNYTANGSTSPSIYSPNQTVTLNVTWQDDSDINAFNFTFVEHNFTGTLANSTWRDPALVGLWFFEDGPGQSIARDDSGNKNGGSLINMNNDGNSTSGWNSSGRYGTALQFDGINDYINITDSPSLVNTSARTISLWFRTNGVPGNQMLLAKGIDDTNEEYEILIVGTTSIYTDFGGPSGGGPWIQPSVTINSNQWYHLAVTFSKTGATSTIKVYVDGTDLGGSTNNPNGQTGQDTDYPLSIGRRASGSTTSFNGTIDEVRIYNRALSAGEIYSQYISHNVTRRMINSTVYNYTDISGGVKSWRVYANDSSNAWNKTETVYFTVNKSQPLFNMSNVTGMATSINTSGLVFYAPFQNSTTNSAGNLALDMSGDDNHGTLTNMNTTGNSSSGWTTNGKIGDGMIFDGINDLIDAGNNPSLNTPDALTVAFWADPSPDGRDTDFINKYLTTNANRSWAIYTSINRVRFTVDSDGTNTVTGTATGTTNVTVGGWHHIAGVYDGARVRVYVDGVEENSVAYTSGINQVQRTLRLGQSQFEAWFNGTMDEVMIFNRALTADEIRILNNSRVEYPTTTNFTGTSNVSQITSTFYRNRTSIGSANISQSISLGAGYYYYVLNTSGNDNYTRMALSLPLTIEKNDLSNLAVWIDNASSNKTVSTDTVVEIRGNETPTGGTATFQLYMNNSIRASGNPASEYGIFPSGIWQIRYNVTAPSENYTGDKQNGTMFLTVRGINTLNMYINTTLNGNHTYLITDNADINATGVSNFTTTSNWTGAPAEIVRNATTQHSASMIINGQFEVGSNDTNGMLGWDCPQGCRMIKSTVSTGNSLFMSDGADAGGDTANSLFGVSGLNASSLRVRWSYSILSGTGTLSARVLKDNLLEDTLSMTSGAGDGYINLANYNSSTRYTLEFLATQTSGTFNVEIDNVHIANSTNSSYRGVTVTDWIKRPAANSIYNFTLNGTDNSSGITYYAFVRPTPSSIIIYQDGIPGDSKFEYGRSNINISVRPNVSSAYCVVFEGRGFENRSCYPAGTTAYLNYTVGEAKHFNFSDGLRYNNTTFGQMPANVTLNLTRYKNVTNAFVNLTGYNNIYGVAIDIGGDGWNDAIFPGYVNSSRYISLDSFTNNLTSELLFFPSSGSFTRYLNYSTAPMNFSNSSDHNYMNITLQLWDQDANTVPINFSENFTSVQFLNRSNSNSSIGAGANISMFVYDDFSGRPQNMTRRWSTQDHSSGGSGSSHTWSIDTSNFTTVTVTDGNNDGNAEGWRLKTNDIDIKYHDKIEMSIDRTASGVGTSTFEIGIINNNTGGIAFIYSSSTTSALNTANDILVFNQTGSTLRSYLNGVLTGLTGLDESANYSLIFSVASLKGAGSNRITTLDIDSINMSGIRGNQSAGYIFRNSTIRSTLVQNSSSLDFTIATLQADAVIPSGTSINWYLSANNGTTWESVTLNSPHLFSTTGKGIAWRADIFANETGNETQRGFPTQSPIIRSVSISGPSGNVTNITIDVGNDGVIEFNYTDELNASSSPRNASLGASSVADYIFANCNGVKSCLVPVKISSDTSGILNYTNLSASINSTNLKILNWNRTRTDDLMQNNAQVNWTIRAERGGTLEITNFTFDYPDDMNYTITVTLNDTVNYTTTSNQSTLITRHSAFVDSLTDPLGWDIIPPSANATGIPAEGQNSTHGIFNISTNATYDNLTLFVRIDESLNTCMNITFSNTSAASNGFNVTTSFTAALYNVSNSGRFGLWTFGYFNACSSGLTMPNITWSPVCESCIRGVLSP